MKTNHRTRRRFFSSPVCLRFYASVILVGLIFLCGCQKELAPTPNFFYLNPDTDLKTIGRVALLELNNSTEYPGISSDMTQAVFAAMQKEQVFGMTTIYRDQPRWKNLQIRIDDSYTLNQLVTIRDTFGVNALLMGTVTEYKPYPYVIIAVRLKLIDLSDGRLLWALEQIWDSSDQATQKRIEQYTENQLYSDSSSMQQEIMRISPRRFMKFASYEIGRTLHRPAEPARKQTQ